MHLEGNYFLHTINHAINGALISPLSTVRSTHAGIDEFSAICSSANVTIGYIDIGNVVVETRKIADTSSTKGIGLLVGDIVGNSNVTIDSIKILDYCSSCEYHNLRVLSKF